MFINVKTEADRLPAAVVFAKDQIDDLNREIYECDYIEDVNGDRVYAPGSYAEEKRDLEHEKRRWEIMISLLTSKPPFSQQDW